MKTTLKLSTLGLLGGTFRILSISAFISAIYFLYQALAHDAPWIYLLYSIVVALVAMQTAVSIFDSEQRLDYVQQLVDRGYVRVDAEAAWRTAETGGMNLLRNLHQVELADEIERLESELEPLKPEDTGN